MNDTITQAIDRLYGNVFRAYIARCVGCGAEQAIYPSTVDGTQRLYRDGAEWQLRNLHYWKIQNGKWTCPSCVQDAMRDRGKR
jgi:hypothetical protein